MLILNILTLGKNKIISLKYSISSGKITRFPIGNKYIYNNLDKAVIELIGLLNSLTIAYLYIYKYISLKQKLLLSTNYVYHMPKLKLLAALTSNYYIVSDNIYSRIFSNWELLRRKLIIYKWLKYFFLANLSMRNTSEKIFYNNYNLYLLYLKLKLKYDGLKDMRFCPFTLIFVILGRNKSVEEIVRLKKNIIIINEGGVKNNTSPNVLMINTAGKNFSLVRFVLEIISTAVFHGLL